VRCRCAKKEIVCGGCRAHVGGKGGKGRGVKASLARNLLLKFPQKRGGCGSKRGGGSELEEEEGKSGGGIEIIVIKNEICENVKNVALGGGGKVQGGKS